MGHIETGLIIIIVVVVIIIVVVVVIIIIITFSFFGEEISLLTQTQKGRFTNGS